MKQINKNRAIGHMTEHMTRFMVDTYGMEVREAYRIVCNSTTYSMVKDKRTRMFAESVEFVCDTLRQELGLAENPMLQK